MKSGSLCALLWRLLSSCNQRQIVLRARHIRGHLNVIANKLSRHKQVIQTEWSLLQRFLTYSARGGLICDQIQSQTSQVCVTGSGPSGLESRCFESSMGGSGHLCLPSDYSSGTSGQQAVETKMSQNDPACTRMAQHAMVVGSGQHVSSNSPHPPKSGEFVNPTIQSVSAQGSSQSESTCLAPRTKAIQQAGFSDEVATRIEAPQRRSTRAVFELKWTVFVRWCEKNKVDFWSSSIKQVADFLLYLFQEKLLQPSTIDGYRTALADKVGNNKINISKDENLTRLLYSFHRDKPKGRRGVPSWNLSLVLHQLTKAPFEPLWKASLKHLTFEIAFILALGSGKRRTEIHAWVHRNIRHQEDWSTIGFSVSFLRFHFKEPSSKGRTKLFSSGDHSGSSCYLGQVTEGR